jgi:hypothetical protein
MYGVRESAPAFLLSPICVRLIDIVLCFVSPEIKLRALFTVRSAVEDQTFTGVLRFAYLLWRSTPSFRASYSPAWVSFSRCSSLTGAVQFDKNLSVFVEVHFCIVFAISSRKARGIFRSRNHWHRLQHDGLDTLLEWRRSLEEGTIEVEDHSRWSRVPHRLNVLGGWSGRRTEQGQRMPGEAIGNAFSLSFQSC